MDYLGYTLLTIMVSFLITLVFEVPFLELEKIMFPKKKTANKSEKRNEKIEFSNMDAKTISEDSTVTEVVSERL